MHTLTLTPKVSRQEYSSDDMFFHLTFLQNFSQWLLILYNIKNCFSKANFSMIMVDKTIQYSTEKEI